ncbi:hypothetical protein BBK82_22290 [Lentzea guizhouensis]|uniref:AMIN-like domain-containing protein n=1 Tax=Lentzea guizhouensis TaxID=1586287 RepID=A0A1B2HKZ4_9PSEU|nr:hypothetical protein [Lentzea guizhouensis]ANZ38389.1 hypothetical protein BBK82_22290 [Lentzea guizhouensis]
MKRFAAALIAVGTALSVVPQAAAAEYAELTNVRTGRHATFDRVVFDLTGGQPQDSASVVAQPENCGSGKPISAPGVEFLEVRLTPADAHGYTGSRNFTTPDLANVRSVVFTCDFEADLSIAIGLGRANAGYRAFFLTSPPRYVVDIDH